MEDGRLLFEYNDEPEHKTHSDVFETEDGDYIHNKAILCGRASPEMFTVGTIWNTNRDKLTDSKAIKLLDKMYKKFPEAKMVYCGTKMVENCFAEVY
jgi:hypothetical protein